MVKVNFSKIVVKDIEGNDIEADFQKQLGNQMYMQGQNIEECELGKRIYHAYEKDDEGNEVGVPMELKEKECAIVRKFIQGYSFIAREAIEKAME